MPMPVVASGSWWDHVSTHSETLSLSSRFGTSIQVSDTSAEHDYGSNWQFGQNGGWSNHSELTVEHHDTNVSAGLNWYGVGAPALLPPVITLAHAEYHVI